MCNQISAVQAFPLPYLKESVHAAGLLGPVYYVVTVFHVLLICFENHIETFDVYYIGKTGDSIIFSASDSGFALKYKLTLQPDIVS